MPYEEEVIEGERYALIRGYGEVLVQQRIEVMQRLLKEPAFAPGMPVLVDVRDVEKTPGFDGIEQIARAQARMLAGHPVAYLTNPGTLYGMTRQVATLTEVAGGGQTQVFTDYDEAVSWIRAFSPNQRGPS
jgi:hypothetical protein